MKKKIKLVSIALAIFMILPMLFALVVSADGPAYPSYADAQDGDLLYKANFNGDTYWVNPGTETGKANAGWNWNQADKAILTGTVDSEDSGKANFKAEGAVQNSAWGADLASLPLEAGYSYTFKFTVTRTANNPIGLLIDGHHGAYVYAVRARIQKNGNALAGHSYVNYSDDVPAKSPSAETPSVQNFAITVEDVHIDSESGLKLFTYTLYVKGTNGGWIKIDEGVPVSDETRDMLGLYFYTYYNTDVTVSEVRVYKGNKLH